MRCFSDFHRKTPTLWKTHQRLIRQTFRNRYPKGRDCKNSGEITDNGEAGSKPVRRQGLLVKNMTADSFDSFFLLGPPRFDAGRMIKQGSL